MASTITKPKVPKVAKVRFYICVIILPFFCDAILTNSLTLNVVVELGLPLGFGPCSVYVAMQRKSPVSDTGFSQPHDLMNLQQW